jgi:hypothetical protein
VVPKTVPYSSPDITEAPSPALQNRGTGFRFGPDLVVVQRIGLAFPVLIDAFAPLFLHEHALIAQVVVFDLGERIHPRYQSVLTYQWKREMAVRRIRNQE